MESAFSDFLFSSFVVVTFVVITFVWWNLSRTLFISLYDFAQDVLKLQRKYLQYFFFIYGIFGPLSLINISLYFYICIIFFKLFIF